MRKHHVFNLALLAGLVFAGSACERDTRDRADRKVDEMNRRADEQVHDMGRRARDVGRDINERTKDVGREVRDRADDVGDRARDVGRDVKERTEDVGERTREMGRNMTDEGREMRENVTGAAPVLDASAREGRIATLDAVIATTESQPEMIRAAATLGALPATDRAAIDDKLQLLQARTDEAKTLIGTLREVEPQNWDARNEVIDDAMKRVDVARDDAWQALSDASDHAPTSMR